MSFEQIFTLKCLECVENILSDEEELNKSMEHYTENKPSQSRLLLNTKITEASKWEEQDKLILSAAVFEAIARSSLFFYAENDERAQEIIAANAVFLEQCLPQLTEKTNPEYRMNSVKENILQMKRELKYKIESNKENPYAFFTPVTAGLVVMAAAATTIALLSYKA